MNFTDYFCSSPPPYLLFLQASLLFDSPVHNLPFLYLLSIMPRSRAAPSRPAAAHHAAPSKPAPPVHNTAPQSPHSAQQPQVINVHMQRGGGGSGILGTMLGVAGGSVLGHGISNYLYGGNTQAPSQPAEAQSLAQAASNEGHVCAPQLSGYSKCLENLDANQCKWAWDSFLQCQQSNTNATAPA